ncbi:MAG TPA: hypothetical protein VIG80_10650 [Bacillaceae bacterium]
MLQLLKFELYKIYSQKSIYIMLLLILAFITYATHFDRSGEQEYQQFYRQWEGTITSDKAEKLMLYRDRINNLMDQGEQPSKEEFAVYNISEAVTYRLLKNEGRKAEIKELEKALHEAVYPYEKRETELKLSMLSKIDATDLYYHKGPAIMMDMIYTFGFVMTAFLTIIGIGPIFSREYSTGMDQFLLSSKHGRSKAVTAKILAAIIFILSVVTVWAVFSSATAAYTYGMNGWKASLQSLYPYYLESPYPFTLGQTYAIMLAIHVTAAIAFGLVTVFISSISPKVMAALMGAGLLFGVPLVLDTVLSADETIAVKALMDLSIYKFMKTKEMFMEFHAYNILGFPVLHPVLAVILSILYGALFWMMTKRIMRKRQISL